MKAVLKRKFRSKNPNKIGKKMWQYKLSGKPEEIERILKQKAGFLIQDKATNEILWNVEEDHGQSPEIVETQDGKFSMILDHEQVAYEKAEQRPLFANMYFKQAENRENETFEEKRARLDRTATKKKVVAGADIDQD